MKELLVILIFIASPLFAETKVIFSPDGGIQKEIIADINQCSKTLDVMIYSLTSENIAQAILEANNRGVRIRIITDSLQSKGKYSLIDSLISKGIKIKAIQGKDQGVMYNKVAIFDSLIVFSGSYNWTTYAEHYNHENALFIDDPNTVKIYKDKFEELWLTN